MAVYRGRAVFLPLRSFFPIQPNVQPSGLNWTDLDTLSGHMAATVGNGGIVEWSSS
jgi:hypothetical protein